MHNEKHRTARLCKITPACPYWIDQSKLLTCTRPNLMCERRSVTDYLSDPFLTVKNWCMQLGIHTYRQLADILQHIGHHRRCIVTSERPSIWNTSQSTALQTITPACPKWSDEGELATCTPPNVICQYRSTNDQPSDPI